MSTTFTRGENPLRADKLNTAFSERVSRGGDTMQGRLILAGDPVAAFDAATKQYVDRFTSMGVPTGAYIGSAPPGNVLGPLWWDNVSGQLFIQYNDGSSTQWVSANSIDASTLEGSFLPLTGGTMQGPLNYTATGGTVSRSAQDRAAEVKHVADYGGSIQAAIDALPAAGGTVMLSPNTTYVVTTAIVSAKPNVHLSAPGWGTVIQRGPALAGIVLQLNGAGCLIEGMTLDGNGVVNTSGTSCPAEIQISGARSRITNTQVINSSAQLNIAVSGDNSRVDHCVIIGRGVDLGTERGDGIWTDTANQVTIDHNHITGTGLSAIIAGGNGTIIDSNYMRNCRWYAGGPGGIIGSYPNASGNTSITISNNVILGGGSLVTGGIEVYGNNVTVTGNTIINQYGSAIGLGRIAPGISRGFTVTGNHIINVGLDMSGSQDGIVVSANVTDFVISGNRIADDQATPTMRWAVSVAAGTSDRYVITDNIVVPNQTGFPNTRVADGGTGTHKVIRDNVGSDDILPNVFSAASINIPSSSPVVHLLNSGTLTITSIVSASTMLGTVKTVLPNAAFVFQAGNNIQNTITTTPNVPFTMTCDETGKWWLDTVPSGGPFLPLTGGTLGGGLSFGSVVAASATDLSKHLTIYSTGPGAQYGFNLSFDTIVHLNYVSSGVHTFVVGSTPVLQIDGGTMAFTGRPGFNGTTPPLAKPTVTGSKGANAALASLLTALAAYGLVTDSST